MYLLDTVVISELRKKKPNPGLLRWVSKQDENNLHLSVVTLGEIERGIELQRVGQAEFADVLSAWLESLVRLYADRIVPVSAAAARRWGLLSARLGHDGADLLIAATAQVHGMSVVTRNVKDFEPTRVTVVNPFTG